MALYIFTYTAGILTILSPSIFPLFPFLFAKSQRSFLKNGLILLLGIVVTFSLISSLTLAGTEWPIQTDVIGRWIALLFLGVSGLLLIVPILTRVSLVPIKKQVKIQ